MTKTASKTPARDSATYYAPVREDCHCPGCSAMRLCGAAIERAHARGDEQDEADWRSILDHYVGSSLWHWRVCRGRRRRRDRPLMPRAIDLRGELYGRLAPLEATASRDCTGSVIWWCLCECGTKLHASVRAMRSGQTKSCGCLHRDQARQNIRGANRWGKS